MHSTKENSLQGEEMPLCLQRTFPQTGQPSPHVGIAKLHLGENHHTTSCFSTAADPFQRSLVLHKAFASLGRT